MYYTLGQRRGLGIGGMSDGTGERWYVASKDLQNNILYVAQGSDEHLFTSSLVATDFNWIPKEPVEKTFDCFAKFRYRQNDQKVTVTNLGGNKIKVDFDQKQKAITPGQFVVLYDKDGLCLGGGIIDKSE
jgi:tRNA-specific 2-thiouridylase